jgi:phage gpG-like protein
MAAAIAITGAEDLQRMLRRLPEDVFASTKEAFTVATFNAHAGILRRLRGNPMQSRTGNLARTILPEVKGSTMATLKASVYSTAGYARIHELGGVVKARDKYRWLPGGPYLNIPTDANKTGAGVMRRSSTDVFRAGGKVMKGPEGFGLYLNGMRMFRFARKVTIKPQLGMRDTVTAEIPTLLSTLNDLLLKGEPNT